MDVTVHLPIKTIVPSLRLRQANGRWTRNSWGMSPSSKFFPMPPSGSLSWLRQLF
jgi:hypothetical protein